MASIRKVEFKPVDESCGVKSMEIGMNKVNGTGYIEAVLYENVNCGCSISNPERLLDSIDMYLNNRIPEVNYETYPRFTISHKIHLIIRKINNYHEVTLSNKDENKEQLAMIKFNASKISIYTK